MSHLHKDENGVLVKCYHETKSLLTSVNFWIGVSISFPLEHFLWYKVWPFYLVTELIQHSH